MFAFPAKREYTPGWPARHSFRHSVQGQIPERERLGRYRDRKTMICHAMCHLLGHLFLNPLRRPDWFRLPAEPTHQAAASSDTRICEWRQVDQHLSPAFLSVAVKLVDGAFLESPQKPEAQPSERPDAESPEKSEYWASSGSIVTVALVQEELEVAGFSLSV